MRVPQLSWLTELASGPSVVLVIAVVAFVATRVTRFVILGVIRRLARRSLASQRPGAWRPRSVRVIGESGEMWEQRRRHRIDAASRVINHLVSAVIWIVAAIVAFHVLDVDPAFFLSGAGFLGAGLAIGGQHKVNDYLTGLSVHLEDRYGVGDEIEFTAWDRDVHAVVDHVGLFSTRLRDERGTMHLPNASLANVRNLSQEPALTTLHVRVPDDADSDDAASLLRGLAGSDGLTDVVILGDPDGRAAATGEVAIDVRTARRLDDSAKLRLVERAERAIWDR